MYAGEIPAYGDEEMSFESLIAYREIRPESDPVLWYESNRMNAPSSSPAEFDYWLKRVEEDLKEWSLHAPSKAADTL